jgi:integrase
MGVISVTVDGKPAKKTCTDPVKSVAAKKLKALREKYDYGNRRRAASDQTVKEYLEWWLIDRGQNFVDKDKKSQGTVNDYRNSLGYVMNSRLGDVKLIDLTAPDLHDLLVALAEEGRTFRKNGQVVRRGPLSDRTIKRVRSDMIKALKTATSQGRVPSNIARELETPATTDTEPKRALTAEQARLMVSVAEKQAEKEPKDLLVSAFLLLALTSGLRTGEALGAQWERINWEYEVIDGHTYGALDIEHSLKRIRGYTNRDGVKVPERLVLGGVKANMQGEIEASKRIMVLPPAVLQVLKRWRHEQERQRLEAGDRWDNQYGLVFTSDVGTPISPSNMIKYIDRVLVPTMKHWAIGELTRHTFATLLENELEESQLHILTKALGHMPNGVTRSDSQYVHRRPKPIVSEHLEHIEPLLQLPGAWFTSDE